MKSTVCKPCLFVVLFALLELSVQGSGRMKIHPFPRDCRNDVLRNFLQEAEESGVYLHNKQSPFDLKVTAVNGVPLTGDINFAYAYGDVIESKHSVVITMNPYCGPSLALPACYHNIKTVLHKAIALTMT